MKYCNECVHYEEFEPNPQLSTCGRNKKQTKDKVSGEPVVIYQTWKYCDVQREGNFITSLILGACGNGARFFEAKS